MKTREVKWLLRIVLLSGLLVVSGCYPQGPEYIEELDIVFTHHDTQFDFHSLGTYAMPDQIVKITGNLMEGDEVEFVDPIYADVILDRIRANMNEYGWTEVDKDDDPD